MVKCGLTSGHAFSVLDFCALALRAHFTFAHNGVFSLACAARFVLACSRGVNYPPVRTFCCWQTIGILTACAFTSYEPFGCFHSFHAIWTPLQHFEHEASEHKRVHESAHKPERASMHASMVFCCVLFLVAWPCCISLFAHNQMNGS